MFGAAGFWMGDSYSKRYACILPDNFIAIFNRGLRAERESFYHNLQKEEETREKRTAVTSKGKKN